MGECGEGVVLCLVRHTATATTTTTTTTSKAGTGENENKEINNNGNDEKNEHKPKGCESVTLKWPTSSDTHSI